MCTLKYSKNEEFLNDNLVHLSNMSLQTSSQQVILYFLRKIDF